MNSTSQLKEIENSLKKLAEQFQTISNSSDSNKPELIQEFIAGIKDMYGQALEIQHQQAIKSMEEMEAAIAAKIAALTPAPVKAQPVHVESILPRGTAARPEMKEPIQEIRKEVEAIPAPKPMSSHPSMDELLMAAANKTAEANQVQEATRRKKVITDIHDKFEAVPTFASNFDDKETLAKRMAGSKQQNGLAEKHQRKPISDLKISIGTNEKFLFINHLFSSDSQSYSSAIEFLNTCGNIDSARTFINQNLCEKYDWDLSTQPATIFIDLVERRYIS